MSQTLDFRRPSMQQQFILNHSHTDMRSTLEVAPLSDRQPITKNPLGSPTYSSLAGLNTA